MSLGQALALALGLLLLLPLGVQAQAVGTVRLDGRVVHGVEGAAFDPQQVRVTLNVLEGITSLGQESAIPDASGRFAFDVSPAPGRTFFFTVEHQGAAYSAARDLSSLGEPLVVTVFDATHDTSVLAVESYSVIAAGAAPKEGFVEVLERAVVRNDSGMTLVPDQTAGGPAMLSFLRFALPPGAYNLDVRSNLVGGQVIEVDRGFALTTPVLPTEGEPHQFEFVYRLDYAGSDLDLSRTMRFGAESFRFVVPVDIAAPASPRLTDLGATELNGRLLRLLEGQDIESAEVVELTLAGLPTASAFDEARETAGRWYVRYAGPAAVASTGFALLVLAVLRRRGVRQTPAAPRDQLLGQARALHRAYQDGTLSEARYSRECRALRAGLVRLALEERLHPDADEGRRES